MRSLQNRIKTSIPARYTDGTRRPKDIDTIIIHCTAGDRADGAISWLNRTLKNGEGKASYHYIIPKLEAEGIYRTCDPLVIAYHAGASRLPNNLPFPGRSVNSRSIGISFANDNGSDSNLADDDLTEWQWEAGLWLCKALMERFSISSSNILGHREVAPGRKTDPLPRILSMPYWRDRCAYYDAPSE